VRREREYVSLATFLLQLAAAYPPTAGNAVGTGGHGHDVAIDASSVIEGTIVNNDESYFLMEESSPHAYRLTNANCARHFAGKKVRVMGALETPHILTVETIHERH
jgi:hypothetical protein